MKEMGMMCGFVAALFARETVFLHMGQLPVFRSLVFSAAIRLRIKHSWQ
jgi:hypothetical protein